MNWSNLPNLITLARFILVAPVVYFQAQQMYFAALVMFFIAGFSDALDGFLAKRYHWSSRLGAIMDPLADKLLLVCVSLVLTAQGHIPLWLLLMMISRDVIIVSGAVAYQLTIGSVPMEPSLSSKCNTFMQLALLISVLFALAFWPQLMPYTEIIQYLVVATVPYSGLEYMFVWSRRAKQHLSSRR